MPMSSLRLILAALVLTMAAGCGDGVVARVHGRVTCGAKPVKGGILFSPAPDEGLAPAQAVQTELDGEGRYAIALKAAGKFRVVISPGGQPLRPTASNRFPCDLTPLLRTIDPGDNELDVELDAIK